MTKTTDKGKKKISSIGILPEPTMTTSTTAFAQIQYVNVPSNDMQNACMSVGATPKDRLEYEDIDGILHLVSKCGRILFISEPIITAQDINNSMLNRGPTVYFCMLSIYMAQKLYEKNNIKEIQEHKAPYDNKITLVLDEIVYFYHGEGATANQRSTIRRGINKALKELDALRYRLLDEYGNLADTLIRYPLSAMESNWTRNGTLELTFNPDFLDFYFYGGKYTPVSVAILKLKNIDEMKILVKIIDAFTRNRETKKHQQSLPLKARTLLTYCNNIPCYEDVLKSNGGVCSRIMQPTVDALNSLIEQGYITIEKMKLNNQYIAYDSNLLLSISYNDFQNVTMWFTVPIIKGMEAPSIN